MKSKIFISILWIIYIICMGKYGEEAMQPVYNVPLNEVVAKLEYIHLFESMLDGKVREYGELGALPKRGSGDVSVYIAKGNKILFIPEGKTNAEMILKGEMHRAYFSEDSKTYLFYTIQEDKLREEGVPVNFMDGIRIASCEVGENGEQNYSLDDLVWLGTMEMNFDIDTIGTLPLFDTEKNQYINSALEYIEETLRENQKYGSYEIYIYTVERVQEKYAGTNCIMKVAIMGDGIEEFGVFIVYDDGDVFPLSGPNLENTGYFSNLDPEDKALIAEAVRLKRAKICLEVTEEEEVDKGEEAERDKEEDWKKERIDFLAITPREAAEYVEYVYGYMQWFGMKELGYWDGEFEKIDGQKIIMYCWDHDAASMFYFLPESKANAVWHNKWGEECPVYINEKGYMEFYQISTNVYRNSPCHLQTTFPLLEELNTDYMEEDMKKMGEEVINFKDLSRIEMPEIVEDEHIKALKEHVEDLLQQNGKTGKYEIQIGEYEVFYRDRVCISAAVIGEEEYYVRYMIVKFGEDDYYF